MSTVTFFLVPSITKDTEDQSLGSLKAEYVSKARVRARDASARDVRARDVSARATLQQTMGRHLPGEFTTVSVAEVQLTR